ncbi:MAG: L-glutamate gamma-semialdehyde dehydrogenase [Bacteroidia bacterium]|nr:L-glutamate gamma-semialdehyde dehydrogenase [Bacteroidia bacterium]
MNALSVNPAPENEPILGYLAGTSERLRLEAELAHQRSSTVEVPMYIGSERVLTQDRRRMSPPHDHQHTLGYAHFGNTAHVQAAIQAALAAKSNWENLPWEHRAAIFLKAADLISTKYRARILAATMLAQSKNIFQGEIDAVCELADFLRFNVHYLREIYSMQPVSSPLIWNRVEYRPLEGFVFAITPFNFTAIAGNLPASPVLMGNTCVWKPADSQIFSAQVVMEIFLEAGLPPGVINLIYVDGPAAGDVIFKQPDFAGVHFTGSTAVFQHIWKSIGENIRCYKSYPRIVGETGGKDFVLVHNSADVAGAITAITRGAFEFQGQKCSAASRVYLPESIAQSIIEGVKKDVESMSVGKTEDFSNFINAVIDERAFDKIMNYIEKAKNDPQLTLICGGEGSKESGYFVKPTVFVTQNPRSLTMCEEIFGPVLTIYVYPDNEWEKTLELVNTTSPYALTGAIWSQDRYAMQQAMTALTHAAGNLYLNDKPTGAVVGQQPFGGGRASGTNDKAGSLFNLLRWVSPRTIKENFVPPTNYRYGYQ